MAGLLTRHLFKRALIAIALAGLILGGLAWLADRGALTGAIWAARTIPVVIGLAISIGQDLFAGRLGVDAVALVSMSAALVLGETLAGVIVAVMYAGGNLLEDFAIARAERDLKSLVDRAPRIAHRRLGGVIEDTPVEQVTVGDTVLVLAGEIVPVDGMILSESATLDEAALTGEPIPVTHGKGEQVYSGTINAGEASN
jgi:cation transport ATPase